MHIFIPDLHEHAARLGQQFAGGRQPLAQVGQVRVNPQLPRVAEGPNLLGLAGGVLGLAVLHVALAGADLPVGAELDAVGRVEVDGLHPAAEALLFGQAGHDQQRVAEDHAVGPVLLVPVEVDLLVELAGAAVEVGEERELLAEEITLTPAPSLRGRGRFGRRVLGRGLQVFDQGLGVDFFLDVDGEDRDGEVFAVLLVLALPDELRVERGIAGIEKGFGGGLVGRDEIAQLLGGDVGALVLVADGVDRGN